MPLLLIIAGLLLVVTAYENTSIPFFQQLAKDIPGFGVWAAAIVAIGMLGYITALRTPARALLALVIIVIFLTNYQKIIAAVTSTNIPAAPQSTALEPKPLTDPFPVQIAGGTPAKAGGAAGGIGGVASSISGLFGGSS